MKDEIKALEDNETWTLVLLSNGKRPIECKCVYKVKYIFDGSLERYKAKLVQKALAKRQIMIIVTLFLLLQKWSQFEHF